MSMQGGRRTRRRSPAFPSQNDLSYSDVYPCLDSSIHSDWKGEYQLGDDNLLLYGVAENMAKMQELLGARTNGTGVERNMTGDDSHQACGMLRAGKAEDNLQENPVFRIRGGGSSSGESDEEANMVLSLSVTKGGKVWWKVRRRQVNSFRQGMNVNQVLIDMIRDKCHGIEAEVSSQEIPAENKDDLVAIKVSHSVSWSKGRVNLHRNPFLETSYDDAVEFGESLLTTFEALTQEMDDDDSQDGHAEAEDQLTYLRDRVDELESDLTRTDTWSSDLENRINSIRDRLAETRPLEQDTKEVNEQLGNMKLRVGDLQARLSDTNKVSADIDERLQAANETGSFARSKRQSDAPHKQLRPPGKAVTVLPPAQQIEALKAKMNTLQSQLNRANQASDALEQRLRDLNRTVEEVQKEQTKADAARASAKAATVLSPPKLGTVDDFTSAFSALSSKPKTPNTQEKDDFSIDSSCSDMSSVGSVSDDDLSEQKGQTATPLPEIAAEEVSQASSNSYHSSASVERTRAGSAMIPPDSEDDRSLRTTSDLPSLVSSVSSSSFDELWEPEPEVDEASKDTRGAAEGRETRQAPPTKPPTSRKSADNELSPKKISSHPMQGGDSEDGEDGERRMDDFMKAYSAVPSAQETATSAVQASDDDGVDDSLASLSSTTYKSATNQQHKEPLQDPKKESALPPEMRKEPEDNRVDAFTNVVAALSMPKRKAEDAGDDEQSVDSSVGDISSATDRSGGDDPGALEDLAPLPPKEDATPVSNKKKGGGELEKGKGAVDAVATNRAHESRAATREQGSTVDPDHKVEEFTKAFSALGSPKKREPVMGENDESIDSSVGSIATASTYHEGILDNNGYVESMGARVDPKKALRPADDADVAVGVNKPSRGYLEKQPGIATQHSKMDEFTKAHSSLNKSASKQEAKDDQSVDSSVGSIASVSVTESDGGSEALPAVPDKIDHPGRPEGNIDSSMGVGASVAAEPVSKPHTANGEPHISHGEVPAGIAREKEIFYDPKSGLSEKMDSLERTLQIEKDMVASAERLLESLMNQEAMDYDDITAVGRPKQWPQDDAISHAEADTDDRSVALSVEVISVSVSSSDSDSETETTDEHVSRHAYLDEKDSEEIQAVQDQARRQNQPPGGRPQGVTISSAPEVQTEALANQYAAAEAEQEVKDEPKPLAQATPMAGTSPKQAPVETRDPPWPPVIPERPTAPGPSEADKENRVENVRAKGGADKVEDRPAPPPPPPPPPVKKWPAVTTSVPQEPKASDEAAPERVSTRPPPPPLPPLPPPPPPPPPPPVKKWPTASTSVPQQYPKTSDEAATERVRLDEEPPPPPKPSEIAGRAKKEVKHGSSPKNKWPTVATTVPTSKDYAQRRGEADDQLSTIRTTLPATRQATPPLRRPPPVVRQPPPQPRQASPSPPRARQVSPPTRRQAPLAAPRSAPQPAPRSPTRDEAPVAAQLRPAPIVPVDSGSVSKLASKYEGGVLPRPFESTPPQRPRATAKGKAYSPPSDEAVHEPRDEMSEISLSIVTETTYSSQSKEEDAVVATRTTNPLRKWEKWTNDQGQEYYYNPATRVAQWEKPDDYVGDDNQGVASSPKPVEESRQRKEEAASVPPPVEASAPSLPDLIPDQEPDQSSRQRLAPGEPTFDVDPVEAPKPAGEPVPIHVPVTTPAPGPAATHFDHLPKAATIPPEDANLLDTKLEDMLNLSIEFENGSSSVELSLESLSTHSSEERRRGMAASPVELDLPDSLGGDDSAKAAAMGAASADASASSHPSLVKEALSDVDSALGAAIDEHDPATGKSGEAALLVGGLDDPSKSGESENEETAAKDAASEAKPKRRLVESSSDETSESDVKPKTKSIVLESSSEDETSESEANQGAKPSLSSDDESDESEVKPKSKVLQTSSEESSSKPKKKLAEPESSSEDTSEDESSFSKKKPIAEKAEESALSLGAAATPLPGGVDDEEMLSNLDDSMAPGKDFNPSNVQDAMKEEQDEPAGVAMDVVSTEHDNEVERPPQIVGTEEKFSVGQEEADVPRNFLDEFNNEPDPDGYKPDSENYSDPVESNDSKLSDASIQSDLTPSSGDFDPDLKDAIMPPTDSAVAEVAPKEAFTKAFSAIAAAPTSTLADNRSVSVDSSMGDDKFSTTDSLGPEFDVAEVDDKPTEAPQPLTKHAKRKQKDTKRDTKKKKKKKKKESDEDSKIEFPYDEVTETSPEAQNGPEMDEPVAYEPPKSDILVSARAPKHTSPLRTSMPPQPRQIKVQVPVHVLPPHPPVQLTNVEDAFERLSRLKDRLRSLKVLMDANDQSPEGPRSLEAQRLLAYYQNGGDHPLSGAMADFSRELQNAARFDDKKPSPIDEAYGALLRAQSKLRSLRALAKARKPY